MKTAVASEDGPDKKKFGIPKKDSKGLKSKTQYASKDKESLLERRNVKPKPKVAPSGSSDKPPKPPSKNEKTVQGKSSGALNWQNKSYKVVSNKLKTKDDLNKKNAPSTKKGKK